MMKKTVFQQTGDIGPPLARADTNRFVANVLDMVYYRIPDFPLSVMELTRVFEMGLVQYVEERHSESLSRAVEMYLVTKQRLRSPSYRENCNVLRRLLRESPHLAERSVRSLYAWECQKMIYSVYHTDHTIDKARRLMSGFFRYAIRQKWCRENLVAGMPTLRKKEAVIEVLKLEEIERLLHCACRPEHADCAAAVGIMLWAGVRPTEVARLFWRDVDFADRVIAVAPSVSKTGGARLVSMQPILWRWLQRWRGSGSERIVPLGWVQRWKALRGSAGLEPWRPDTLRHTFASYHLRHFGNLNQLQLEMGHSNSKMLFSRYLNMRNISVADAASFWGYKSRKIRGKCALPGVDGNKLDIDV